MAFIGWIIKNPLLSASLVALTIATGFGGYEFWSASRLSVEVADQKVEAEKLKLEKSVLQDSVNNLTFQVELTKKTQATLSDAIEKLAKVKDDNANLDKEIDNAPPSDDAPAAPVLGNLFDRMRR